MASKARRGYGEGSFFKDERGYWTAVIRYKDASGRNRRRVLRDRDRYKCQQKLSDFRRELRQGTNEPSTLTVDGLLSAFLAAHQTQVGHDTFERLESLSRNHVSPDLKARLVRDLKARELEMFFSELAHDSASTAKKVFALMHQAWPRAVRDRIVAQNVFDTLRAPRYEPEEVQPLSDEQEDALLDAAIGTRLEALYGFALDTGVRQGEAFALRWQDVDLDAGVVRIFRTLKQRNGRLEFGPVKTKASRRRIDLSQTTVAALRAHRKRSLLAREGQSLLVFPDKNGGPIRRQNFNRRDWLTLCKQAHLVSADGKALFSFHDLRHTMASRLLLANVNPKIVQERLGHARVAITLDIYSHLLPTMQQVGADVYDGRVRDRERRKLEGASS